MSDSLPPLVVGVDTGGTFTDFMVIAPDGAVYTHKRLSTPHDPGQAVLDGLAELARLLSAAPSKRLVHGSTVATNAILERKGAATAFVTTQGFRDLLHIGRQSRRALYDLTPPLPRPIIPAEHCFEVPERIGPGGEVIRPLDTASLERVAQELKARGLESVALVFLHSYANPQHEAAAARLLRGLGLRVSASHEILPEHREYERASTTALNAYVSPLMERYLKGLAVRIQEMGFQRFRVMQSSGGVTDADAAGRLGVHTVLSGPAGGVVGALRAGRAAGFTHLITLDMGGTSTDVSLLPGRLLTTTESEIDGMPVRIPVLDIHTVGAGGGSIAHVDAGGALRVGPQSAGADPGPACYGRGGVHFTVTDANFLLGRIPPGWFLGGKMRLDREAAERAGRALAQQLGATLEEAAYGVLRVVNSNMERAVKVISVERGHDPREFTLVSFGGAGSLHAAELAMELEIPRVLVPQHPGVLSAFGMAVADVVRTYVHGVLGPLNGSTLQRAQGAAAGLFERAAAELDAEGVPAASRTYEITVDARYAHQSFELPLPCPGLLDQPPEALAAQLHEAFHQAHRAAYGHAHPEEPVELVAVRLRAEGKSPAANPRLTGGKVKSRGGAAPSPEERRPVFFASGWVTTPVYPRESLPPGCTLPGPAIVVEEHATTVLPPGCSLTVLETGALLITTANASTRRD